MTLLELKATKISVVMSVYHGDCDRYFDAAVKSLLCQTLTPSQIVIAVDGPVKKHLDGVIKKYNKMSNFTVVRLKKNVGSGAAKKVAFDFTKHPIVAIMDADDISVPTRFEKQAPFLVNKQADVVGGWISEFKISPGDINRIRNVPRVHSKILKLGKWRNPINHVSLMFTKDSYDRAGGYPNSRFCEDWELIFRMSDSGSKIINLPEVLVNVRAGSEMIRRRGSVDHFKSELNLFRLFYKEGYINFFEFSVNILVRLTFIILPNRFVEFLYKVILRRKR